MQTHVLTAIAQSSAERIVNCTFEGLLLALVAWVVLRLVPRQNAGTRFSVWMATLMTIASLPLAEGVARALSSGQTPVAHAPFAVPAAWGTALFVTWLVIAGFLLLKIFAGLVQLYRLRHRAQEVTLECLDALPRQTLAEFQSVRRVSLCVSESVSVPTAVGLFAPAVVLPTWSLAELSPTELNSVLVHELAHLRRRDDWTNLLQKLVRAVFFFHPAVWWIESRLSLEREMACDEHVLARTGNARAYAQCLVSLAEKGILHRAAVLAQGAVHRMKECSARVARILESRPGTVRISRAALASVAVGSTFFLITFANSPDIVAFRSQSPAPLSSAHSQSADLDQVNDAPAIVPAAWHPQSDAMPTLVPAKLVVKETANDLGARPLARHARKKSNASVRKNPVVTAQPMPAQQEAAPRLFRAGFTQTPDFQPAALVFVSETGYYTDGVHVWAVSFYRMTVFKPQVATQHEVSRKAI